MQSYFVDVLEHDESRRGDREEIFIDLDVEVCHLTGFVLIQNLNTVFGCHFDYTISVFASGLPNKSTQI